MVAVDATRMIAATGRALKQSGTVQGQLAECWQVCALVEVVGSLLANGLGPPGSGGVRAVGVQGAAPSGRAAAEALAEAGMHGRVCLAQCPPTGTGTLRAALIDGIADPALTLRQLGELLDSASSALFEIIALTEEEPLYWPCLEAGDALAEVRDRLDRLTQALGPAPPGQPPRPPLPAAAERV
jgi:hypothetical protein